MFQNDLQYAISENFSIWRLVCLESRIRENSFLAEKRGFFSGLFCFFAQKVGSWAVGCVALGLNEATSFSEKGEKGKGREIAKFGKYYLPEYLS